MGSGKKKTGKVVTCVQHSDTFQRNNAKNYREDTVGAAQTSAHKSFSDASQKETVKASYVNG
jgi:hypothetical protein